MQIVIEIDKDRYEDTKRIASVQMNYRKPTIEQIVANGTPLDKMIEDIKQDIADFMSEIPTLGNCKEGWHNSGQRIGLEQACEIIDKYRKEQE